MKKVLFFILAVATVGLVACGGDGLTEVFLEAGTSGGSSSGGSSSGDSDSSGSGDGCWCYAVEAGADSASDYTTTMNTLGKSCSEFEDYLNETGASGGLEIKCYEK